MIPPRNACSHPRRNIRLRTTLKGEMRLMPAPQPRIQGVSRKQWHKIQKLLKTV
jgi:hypothetical protein